MKKKEGVKKIKADIYLKKLQNKLRYYRQVVIDSNNAIIIQDFNGIIKAWNKGAERIYGFKEKEMLGRNIIKIICKEDRADVKANILSIKNGKPSFIVKQTRITKDNKKVFVNITYSPIYDLEEVVEIATTEEDVTELKKSLENIKNAALKYKQLFDYMSEAVVIYEVKNNGRDIIIKDVNRAAEKLEKVSKKDIVGKKVEEVFVGVKKFGLYDVFKKVWKTAMPIHHPISFYEDRFRRAWRENYVFKLPSGEVVAVYTDVTKNKQIEEFLKESERKISTTLKSIGDAVIVTNKEGEITFLNFVAQKLTGWTVKEAVGKKLDRVFKIFNEKTGKKVSNPVLKVIQSGNIVGLGNHTILINRNGKKISIEDSAAPIKDDKGVTNGVVLVFHDVTEKREISRKLEESESRFRGYFNMSGAGIAVTSPKKGWVEVNKKLCLMLGYSREEIIKKSWSEMTHPDDLSSDTKQFNRVLSGEIDNYNLDKRFIRKDKGIIWTNLSVGCVRKSNGRVDYITALLIDITDKKLIEEKLKKSYDRYKTIVDNVNDAFYLHDFKGKILDVNENACKMTGYTRNELIGANASIIDTPEQAVFIKNRIQKLFKKGRILFESQHKKKSGNYFWVSVSAKLVSKENGGLIESFVRDITNQKQNEERLRESEDGYRSLVSNLPKTEYVLVYRGVGKLLWTSNNVQEFLGISKKSIPGLNVFKFVEKEYIKTVLKNSILRLAGKKVGDYEIKVTGKNGRVVDVRVRGSNINYHGQSAVLLILSDITEKIKKEKEILREKIFLDSIIDLNPNAIQITDKSGYIIRVNKAYMKLFKFKGEKPPLENYNWFEDPIARKLGLHEYQQGIKKGKILDFPEMPYNPSWVDPKLPNINLFFHVIAFPIMDSKNKLDKFVLMYDDITEKKAAELKIQENEIKYKSLFDLSNDAVFLMEGNTFIDCNEKTLKMFGCKRNEIIGKSPYKFSPKKQPDGTRSIDSAMIRINSALRGKPQFFEWRHSRLDGTEFDTEVSLSSIEISNKKYILASVRDVTSSKEALGIIKESEQRYRIITEQTGQLIYDYDLSTGNIGWNGPIESVVGYTKKEFQSFGIEKWATAIDPSDRFAVNKVLGESIKKCKPFNIIYGFKHKDGHYIKVQDSGVFICEKKNKARRMLGVMSNISELIKNKKELEEKNIDLNKFKLAVDRASDDIIITDKEGVILYANPASEKNNGYSAFEIIGKTPVIWGGQMSKEFYAHFWKTIKEEKKPCICEMINKRKNGELYNAEIRVSPIVNTKNEVEFFVGISHDITKLKELDRAKSEFVSVASHQLKTPVSGIKWVLESILKNKENNLTEKQILDLKDVYENNERMIGLINDLLNISRIDSGKYALLNLAKTEIAPMIERAIKESSQLADTRKVKIIFQNKLPINYSINIDHDKIYQAILNLILNSIKYSKADGGVSEIVVKIKNKEFVFSIKDNGIGIPIGNQRHIFEKFYRAENANASNTSGSGLGLYIGKYFIESHKGRIWFDSREGVGTIFTFILRQDLI